jgi:vacuolar-type H+-ATPase subunit D/Vma8
MSGVPPTRMNQQVFKGKKKAAVGGHRLLKKKADALKVRWLNRIELGSATMGISVFDDVNFCRTELAFSY